ncbi:MAG TPA: glycosyltransferase [Acidimicrobiales bacterium]|nr:glycosyltransferase [Acidimicrobiales bacterium]
MFRRGAAPMTTAPLRVEVVVAVGGLGGAERVALSVLDHQAYRLEVSVVALGETPFADAARERGWPVHVVPTGKGPFDIARSTVHLAARWRRSNVDVVWANGVKPAAVAVPAARLVGVPVVWAKHDFSFDRRLARPLAARCTAVIANSEQVAEATGRSDVVVIPPPKPAEPDGDVPRLADAEHVAAFVGRLSAYKGVDDVIRALPAAEPWHLVVIGGDDPTQPGERARLESLATTCSVAERVHFLGDVPDAARRLAGADVVVVPTKTNEAGIGREGWSMVADEAMAAGLPVVAACGGALTERLGDAGIPVDQGAPGQIAAALNRLTDPMLRRTMGEAGRRLVAARPDPSASAAEFVSVLAAAARRPGAGLSTTRPVSVVVPFFNEGDDVEPSFAAVTSQLRPGDELVVVDDCSTDGTGDRLATLAARTPGARLVRLSPNQGPGAARNAGAAVAQCDVVACTDAGCRPAPQWLDALRAAFDEARPPALVTGVYDVTATTPLEQAAAVACYPVVEEARRTGALARLYGSLLGRAFDPRFSNGRSMAFDRAAWEGVGGMPEDLRTAEDVAFGVAVDRAGGRCELSADALVTWDQRPDLRGTARTYYRYGLGDAAAGHRLMIGRNLARVAAYAVGPVALLRGGRATRATVVAGAAFYVSLPVARAARRRLGPAALASVPVAMAVKDVAKGVGCLKGLLLHSRP